MVPYHAEATGEWRLARTWDRLRIPKPFSTVYVAVGEPFFVDRERLKADETGVVSEFSQQMNANAERAQGLVRSG